MFVYFVNNRKTNAGGWEAEYQRKKERRANGFVKSREYAEAKAKGMKEYFEGLRNPFVGEGEDFPPNYLMKELKKAQQNRTWEKSASVVEWVSRGPGNVGGRVRGLIVDPDDPTNNTWFIGTATGGVWKTSDGGNSFTNLTPDIPYLSTTTLVMSPANTNTIYVGTGESFSGRFNTGGGIFKSNNKGQTWEQMGSTSESLDFRYVNRLVIDPENENIVLAATSTGIFKTTNGGANWVKKYENSNVEDLDADPNNFSILYGCINSVGVVKSTDAGESWNLSSEGITNGYRFELAISPSNPDKIYVSGEFTDEVSVVYVSSDGAQSWEVFKDMDSFDDFLGGQGWYDNTIAVDPYDENIFFVGGVNIWKLTRTDSVEVGAKEVTRVDENNTGSFIQRVSFSGNTFTGLSVSETDAHRLVESDWASVEIRFGPDKKQKAYRFEVPFQATSGVAASSYLYKDFVEVPFEVWDITNNKQLSVSFRDQERDGAFNLYPRSPDELEGEYGLLGREYIYVNAVDYDENGGNSNLTRDGGHQYKNLYMLWAILPENGTWNAANLPESNIKIVYSSLTKRFGTVRSVADAYNNYGGGDNYKQSQGFGSTSIPGFHPDHHNLIPIKQNDAQKEYWILNANDGGLGISKDNGENWTQIKKGMVTTQFYGVAKRPGQHQYFGGMQDNGSWQSALIGESDQSSSYFFKLGGDGFECIWHQTNDLKIIGSVYNNAFYRSTNRGQSWSAADAGIDEDGPFISRLANSPQEPDRLYAVGTNGLWVSDDFGASNWTNRSVGINWTSGDVTSWHLVEVSPANNSVIYCGASNSPENGLAFYASTNKGTSFTEGKAYTIRDLPYYFRSITPHPNEEGTVFISYAAYGVPKILRSKDYGQTWEDLTGYGATGTSSSNGFPEVPCNCLLIFPEHPNQLWAGTDIGIFQSKDSGATWEILNSDMPSVPITQMFLQDGNVVIATYGRGIWSVEYDNLVSNNAFVLDDGIQLDVYPNPSKGDINLEINGDMNGELDVLVYDMAGKTVYSDKCIKNFETLKTSFQLDVRPGNYTLVLRNTEKRISKKILISD